jgi:hypothetical protein
LSGESRVSSTGNEAAEKREEKRGRRGCRLSYASDTLKLE